MTGHISVCQGEPIIWNKNCWFPFSLNNHAIVRPLQLRRQFRLRLRCICALPDAFSPQSQEEASQRRLFRPVWSLNVPPCFFLRHDARVMIVTVCRFKQPQPECQRQYDQHDIGYHTVAHPSGYCSGVYTFASIRLSYSASPHQPRSPLANASAAVITVGIIRMPSR